VRHNWTWVSVCLLLMASPATGQDTDPMIEFVRQGILHGETAVETVRWDALLTQEMRPEIALPGQESLRRKSEGVGKGLRTRLSLSPVVAEAAQRRTTYFWGTDRVIRSSPRAGRATISDTSDVGASEVRCGFDPRSYGRYAWEIPLSQCLVEYPCKYLGREEINGSTCEVIEVDWADRGETVKVWVDPDVGFLIRRCEVLDDHGRLTRLQELEEIASSGDAHFPKKARRRSYGPLPSDTDGEFVCIATAVMECEMVVLNEAVEDSEVVFEPLPGQRVYDTTAPGGPRVASVPGEGAVLDSLVQEATGAVQESEPAPAAEPLKAVVPASSPVVATKRTAPQRQRFVGVALIVLAALAACAVVYMKVSKRSAVHRETE